MRHTVVVRYKDGTVAKGTTADFAPNRDSFTLDRVPAAPDGPAIIRVEELKAVFFVRSHEGNPDYREHKPHIPAGTIGRRYLLTSTDGETMRGTALGAKLSRHGFLLFPSDPGGNNKRIFDVHSAMRELRQEP